MKLTKSYIKSVILETLEEGRHPDAWMHDQDRNAGLEDEDDFYSQYGYWPGQEPSRKAPASQKRYQGKDDPEVSPLMNKIWDLKVKYVHEKNEHAMKVLNDLWSLLNNKNIPSYSSFTRRDLDDALNLTKMSDVLSKEERQHIRRFYSRYLTK